MNRPAQSPEYVVCMGQRFLAPAAEARLRADQRQLRNALERIQRLADYGELDMVAQEARRALGH